MKQSQVPASGKTVTADNSTQQDIGRNQGQAIGQMHGGQAVNAQEIGVFVSGGNVVFQNNGINGSPQQVMQLEREIPSLLPYLANRTDQEYELGQAIQKSLTKPRRRPIVCIVHGDEYQSHDKFLERLRKISIARLLRLNLHETTIKEYQLAWPSNLKKLEKLSTRLCRNLADTVEQYSLATSQQINQTLGKYPGPVIIHTHLLTEDWERQGFEVLPSLLKFWQDWPHLASNQTLIVCICVKYQIKRQKYSSKWWSLKTIATSIRQYFRRLRFHKLNQQITQQLMELSESQFEQFDRLTSIVLPMLENLTQTHVENWARSESTKNFVGEAMLEQLVDSVRDMFELWETQTASQMMSMDDVAEHLIKLLKSLSSSRGEYL